MSASSICISLNVCLSSHPSSWFRWVVMVFEANLSVFPPVCWDQTTLLSPHMVQKNIPRHTLSLLCVGVCLFLSSCMDSFACPFLFAFVCSYNILLCLCVCVSCWGFLHFGHTHLHFDIWFFGRAVKLLALTNATTEVPPNHLGKLYFPLRYATLPCVMSTATAHKLTFIG